MSKREIGLENSVVCSRPLKVVLTCHKRIEPHVDTFASTAMDVGHFRITLACHHPQKNDILVFSYLFILLRIAKRRCYLAGVPHGPVHLLSISSIR